MSRARVALVYAALVIVLVPVWELFGRESRSVRLLVSTPSRIAGFVEANLSDLAWATWITFAEASLGLLLATSAALLLAVLVFFAPKLLRYLLPFMVTSQVIPLIVLAPFFVIAFGIGVSSKVAMAAVLCFFPTFVGLAQGYRLISPNVHHLLDIYETPRLLRIRRVYLPLSLPSAMAGLKVSATLSVIGAIVAEFTGSEVGLGRNLFLSTIRLQPDLMMASLFASALLGGLMYGSIHLLERRLGHWYLAPSGSAER